MSSRAADKATVLGPPGEREIVIERDFAAPPRAGVERVDRARS